MGKYLGTPTINDRMHFGLYQPLLDRIGDRMEGWKINYLSFAGKIILAQSILTTIPLYPMQSSLLPINICNNIDRMVRKFLRGGPNDNKKIHLIKWETVTNEKEQGGLGLKTMHNMNLAFMAKLGWQLVTEHKSLWVKVIAKKCHRGNQPQETQQKARFVEHMERNNYGS